MKVPFLMCLMVSYYIDYSNEDINIDLPYLPPLIESIETELMPTSYLSRSFHIAREETCDLVGDPFDECCTCSLF
jgi:hypothetical protein